MTGTIKQLIAWLLAVPVTNGIIPTDNPVVMTNIPLNPAKKYAVLNNSISNAMHNF